MAANTPPMGWNSWDCYGASVDEETVRRNAEFMAQHLKKYGWEYIVVDIQWYEPKAKNHEYNHFTELCMDRFGRLIPAENRFPSSSGERGFGPLAKYVHSLGLKFGIHIMRGIPRQAVAKNTPIKKSKEKLTARQIAKIDSICAWNTDMYGIDAEKPGAREYYESLFSLYESWGVDFVKVDDICRELPAAEGELMLISDALKNCGRDMVLSLSPGAALPEKAELYKQVSNMWRITDDFWDNWPQLYDMFDRAQTWCIHAGAGHFPDCDMLPVGAILQDYGPDGWTKFTQDEQRVMMTLWSIVRSPMMIGSELTKLDEFTMGLLTNPIIIEMLKFSHSAHPLYRRKRDGSEEIVWFASHKDGRNYYVALFNVGEKPLEISVNLPVSSVCTTVEAWTGEKGAACGSVSANVAPHSVALIKLTKTF